jgi:uncharacterized damage-inducible protein DinB
MSDLLGELRHDFQRQKTMADKAMASLDDAAFFYRPGAVVNPVALIVKHLSGNFVSRWTDFLTTDGEKPTRNRDGEFLLTDGDTRPKLMAAWENAWKILVDTLARLRDSDLDQSITIRGEIMTARQALLRGLAHTAYHVGQILYIARLLAPDSPWISIAPGQSQGHPGNYKK